MQRHMPMTPPGVSPPVSLHDISRSFRTAPTSAPLRHTLGYAVTMVTHRQVIRLWGPSWLSGVTRHTSSPTACLRRCFLWLMA